MGLGVSVHKSGGWQGQYERVKRWHSLVQKIGGQQKKGDTEQEHDFVYAFFQNCYHLRDWLQNSRAVAQSKLEDFFRQHEPMRVCQDVCNGTKHWRLDRAKVDAHFSIGREYVPANWPGNRPQLNASWFLICGSTKYDIFQLADTCMSLWDSFLRAEGLLK